jgi:two-component system, NarL family, response regulator NreC
MAQRTSPVLAARVRVLVVDDNEGFRDTLITLLDTDDLLVVGQAATGRDAIDLVLAAIPDVVLMDISMPDMDGVETTRRIKALDPRIGIVALTGSDDQRAVRDMLVAGASGYVLKDSDGDEILHAVHAAAEGGGVISSEVTPSVIEELTEALERERRRIRQLEIAQDALMERAARRHELVSRLGHELRTPVTVILGMAQTLGHPNATDAERAEMRERLIIRAQDLARLVERFESAVEAGMTEWADVVDVAHSVAKEHERVIVQAPVAPIMASLNRQAAGRIVEELVENALIFSPPDRGVLVRVSVRSGRPEVRVSDEGPGIDPALAERMFAPLEQGEGLNTRTHQGAGLGLALARMSAQAMDGDVVLEHTGADGSTFLWTLASAG